MKQNHLKVKFSSGSFVATGSNWFLLWCLKRSNLLESCFWSFVPNSQLNLRSQSIVIRHAGKRGCPVRVISNRRPLMRILSMSDSETSRWVTRVHSCSRSVRPASHSVQVSTVSVTEYWAGLLKHLRVEHLAQGENLRSKQWKSQKNNVTELLTSWFRRSQSDTRAWIWPSFSSFVVVVLFPRCLLSYPAHKTGTSISQMLTKWT